MSINRPALLIIAGAALLCSAVLAGPAWRHWHETPPAPADALRLALPAFDDVTPGAGPDHPFGLALAPDGRRLAFPAIRAGLSQIFLQQITASETTALPGTEGGVLPFWSPDGLQLGFFADGRLKALTIATGAVSDLAEAPAPRGAVWHPNGAIIFAPKDDGGLVEWRPDGTELRALTQVDTAGGETSHRFPALARRPGEESRWDVVFFVHASEATRAGLWTTAGVRLTTSETSALVADDWLLFARGDALFAQRLEWREENQYRPVLAGQAQLMGMPVGRSALGQLFATVGADAIVYGSPQPQLRDLRWIDRRDGTQGTLAAQVDAHDVRIAPHGGRVAATQLDGQLGTLDVWVYEGGRLLPRRISQALDLDELAVWSPDATRLAWVQSRRAIVTRGAQAQLPEQVVRQFDAATRLWDWSPDGGVFVVGRNRPGTKEDLFIVSAGSGAASATPSAGSSTSSGAASAPPGAASGARSGAASATPSAGSGARSGAASATPSAGSSTGSGAASAPPGAASGARSGAASAPPSAGSSTGRGAASAAPGAASGARSGAASAAPSAGSSTSSGAASAAPRLPAASNAPPSADFVPYAQSPFNEVHAAISRDGRWIAYASDESGQLEIYVDSFPAPGHRARVSTGGGAEPRWGADSREVFFRRGREMHVASLALDLATPEATGTARLFDAGGDIRAYDVTPDGQRFLLNVPAPSAKPQPIAVVVNWRSLLK